LRPAPELLIEQPGERDPRRFVATAMQGDGEVAVMYLPQGSNIQLNLESLKRPAVARWFNPRTGEWNEAGTVRETECSFSAPDAADWVLCIGNM